MRYATAPVTIIAYTDDHQPGWVEGYLADASGRRWPFYPVKQVYVSQAYLDADTPYPVTGATDCRVVEDRGGVATVELMDIVLLGRDEDYPRVRVPSAALTYSAQAPGPGDPLKPADI